MCAPSALRVKEGEGEEKACALLLEHSTSQQNLSLFGSWGLLLGVCVCGAPLFCYSSTALPPGAPLHPPCLLLP